MTLTRITTNSDFFAKSKLSRKQLTVLEFIFTSETGFRTYAEIISCLETSRQGVGRVVASLRKGGYVNRYLVPSIPVPNTLENEAFRFSRADCQDLPACDDWEVWLAPLGSELKDRYEAVTPPRSAALPPSPVFVEVM